MKRLALMLALVLAGCAGPRAKVVLLPGVHDLPGAVTVTQGQRTVSLAAAYALAEIGRQDITQKQSTAAEVEARYGEVIKAQPPRARSYSLYFVHDGVQLVPESAATLERIRKDLREYPAVEMIIIGHTDRVGDAAYNDRLSARRAEAVRKTLVGFDVPPERVSTVGRGEREPLVPTPDGVAEPRNRRVEIKIR